VISGSPSCCARAAASALAPRRTGGALVACSTNSASLRQVRTSQTAAAAQTATRSAHSNADTLVPNSVCASTGAEYQ